MSLTRSAVVVAQVASPWVSGFGLGGACNPSRSNAGVVRKESPEAKIIHLQALQATSLGTVRLAPYHNSKCAHARTGTGISFSYTVLSNNLRTATPHHSPNGDGTLSLSVFLNRSREGAGGSQCLRLRTFGTTIILWLPLPIASFRFRSLLCSRDLKFK